ncbi:MAG: MmcQ/YjbR family DNA-binding protein [Chloroflexota bacterium]|nr:MmcQ/YjbR family DNA-binding protein [Chloroflexota bacterium]
MTRPAPKAALAAIRAYALSFPEAVEAFPWGDQVIKVKGKIFVFLGASTDGGFGISAKLPETHELALTLDGVTPTGYGLGKAGWVTARIAKGQPIDLELYRDWVEESYRAIAPKSLVKTLDATAPRQPARR